MRRRELIAFLAAAAAAPSAAFADAPEPLSKAFPFLDGYLGLPPAQRNRFHLVYRAYRDKKPASGAAGVIIGANGQRTPVPFSRAGEVLSLPSLAELKSGAQFQTLGAPFRLGPELRPTGVAPATHVAVGDLVAALTQANAAIQKLAGVLALAAPKMTAAYFPDAGGGQVLLAGGRAAPLLSAPVPNFGPIPYFEPASQPSAQTVVLTRAPSRILLGGHPKKA